MIEYFAQYSKILSFRVQIHHWHQEPKWLKYFYRKVFKEDKPCRLAAMAKLIEHLSNDQLFHQLWK
jgi:hypothetical protein